MKRLSQEPSTRTVTAIGNGCGAAASHSCGYAAPNSDARRPWYGNAMKRTCERMGVVAHGIVDARHRATALAAFVRARSGWKNRLGMTCLDVGNGDVREGVGDGTNKGDQFHRRDKVVS